VRRDFIERLDLELARPVRGYIAVRLPFAAAVFDGHVGESDGRRDGNNASLRYCWVVMGESRGQRTMAVGGWEHGRLARWKVVTVMIE